MAESAIGDFSREVEGVPFQTAHSETREAIRHQSRRIDCTPSDGKSRNGKPHPDVPAKEKAKHAQRG
jgi:hypothetical protein